jgi:hypothetical protein
MDLFDIFNYRATDENLRVFAQQLTELSAQIGFKVSSRGWCYQLESERLINKNDFDKVERIINNCRKKGILPIDFVAEEEGRQFSGIEVPEIETPSEFLKKYIQIPLNCHNYYTPDWWEGEEYYIQMIVEKVDLKTLFSPVTKQYHLPIATAKGWSSMNQRAEYARRFKKAEEKGLKCVLLYCGDHDPDGLRISDFIKSNLEELQHIQWADGVKGYSPNKLLIHRFGLNADFIYEHGLTWIDNLITGSGKNLASPSHKNHKMPYVQEYIQKFGLRKCEANALVPKPREARFLVENTIIAFLGDDALSRFKNKMEAVKNEMDRIRIKTGLQETIENAIRLIDDEI